MKWFSSLTTSLGKRLNLQISFLPVEVVKEEIMVPTEVFTEESLSSFHVLNVYVEIEDEIHTSSS